MRKLDRREIMTRIGVTNTFRTTAPVREALAELVGSLADQGVEPWLTFPWMPAKSHRDGSRWAVGLVRGSWRGADLYGPDGEAPLAVLTIRCATQAVAESALMTARAVGFPATRSGALIRLDLATLRERAEIERHEATH